MKKLLQAALMVLASVLVTSCEKKDYVCSCVENQGGAFSNHNYELGNITDNSAQNLCDQKQKDLSGIGINASCKTNFK